MDKLKEKLLNTGLFIDNEWLDKYTELILNNSVKAEKFKTQKHHILQEAYFLHYNLKVDNSEENLVDLLYKHHILAHYYLMKCTIDWLKWANQSCFWQMIGRKNIEGLQELLDSLNELQLDYEDFCKANSLNNSGSQNANYGNYWSDEQKLEASIKAKERMKDPNNRKKISDKLKSYYKENQNASKGKKAYFSLSEEKVVYRDSCPEGYTDKTPRWYLDQHSNGYFKQNNTMTKGFVWYTNGIKNKFCLPDDKPEGYYEGRVGSYGSLKNRKAYHNQDGKIIYLLPDDPIPDGFIKGGLFKGKNNGKNNPSYGKHWYTNGVINIHDAVTLEECPPGFKKGQTRGCPNYKLNEVKGE